VPDQHDASYGRRAIAAINPFFPTSPAMITLGLLLILVAILSAWIIFRERAIAAIAGQLEEAVDLTNPVDRKTRSATSRLNDAAKVVGSRLAIVGHRLPQRNTVTGMATREFLMDAIDNRDSGPRGHASHRDTALGVIELLDFERLCAFDAPGADHLIKAVATRITDMVDPARAVAQIDRGRFAIWFGAIPIDDARAEFQALCYALRNRVTGETIDLLPQFSCGMAVEQGERLAGPEMLARAIAVLVSGDGQATVDNDLRIVSARQRFVYEQGLRHAIARHEFRLVYQPFINVEQERVSGGEALLRWSSKDHGDVTPSVFVPIVEAIGMAEEVGNWVLNEACDEAARWPFSGLSDLRVAVNLSALQLGRGDFDTVVQRMLKRHAMPARALELELTETVAAGKSHGISELFQRLRALGVSMSVDDFGTGFSSLSYLKNLKFDKLKIDREFVTSVDRQRDSQAICQSIIALGRGLGIEVLAEGVETFDEFAWLRRHGCCLFQGYYFSRPLPPREFVAFASDRDNIRALIDVGPTALKNRINEHMA
jgi:EAL domain-containing protein (putative c-di-GMP-specific phosphodiesterase class I)/GGDEF domain-containing protein